MLRNFLVINIGPDLVDVRSIWFFLVKRDTGTIVLPSFMFCLTFVTFYQGSLENAKH